MKKKPLNLLVNEDLIKRARDRSINLSAFFEIKLEEHLALIHSRRNKKDHKWTCRDLNPRPPPCQGGDLPS